MVGQQEEPGMVSPRSRASKEVFEIVKDNTDSKIPALHIKMKEGCCLWVKTDDGLAEVYVHGRNVTVWSSMRTVLHVLCDKVRKFKSHIYQRDKKKHRYYELLGDVY